VRGSLVLAAATLSLPTGDTQTVETPKRPGKCKRRFILKASQYAGSELQNRFFER